METINKLLNTAHSENITINYENLNGIANGMCVYDGSEYYILLDHSIKDDTELHKSVLAEELGHYFTMIDDPTPRVSDTYERKCRIDKEENKAARWATAAVMPTDEILDYLATNLRATYEELIEHFQVTDEFMKKKLHFMSLKQEYYEVCENHYLCLQNSPSIYITKFFDADLASKAKALYGRKY